MEDANGAFAGHFFQVGTLVIGVFYFGNHLELPDVKVNIVDSTSNKILEDDIIQVVF